MEEGLVPRWEEAPQAGSSQQAALEGRDVSGSQVHIRVAGARGPGSQAEQLGPCLWALSPKLTEHIPAHGKQLASALSFEAG